MEEPQLVVEFEKVPQYREAKRHFEAVFVEYCLTETGGNVSAAARLAGKDRKDFYKLAKRCGVEPREFRE